MYLVYSNTGRLLGEQESLAAAEECLHRWPQAELVMRAGKCVARKQFPDQQSNPTSKEESHAV